MSHEIRTPLNAIVGMTQIAKNSNNIVKIREYLGKVEISSAHLLELINTVLDLAKIDAGKLSLTPENFDLEKMLSDLMEMFSVQSGHKKQELFVKVGKDVPKFLSGDQMRLSQVIMNLFSNAVKFTPENGKIEMRVCVKERDDENISISFSVSDTGIGMTSDQLKYLFQAFEQADGTITKRFGGTGLGLAISKRIVDMMGGSFSVESAEGRGSVFSFFVKLKADPRDAKIINSISVKSGAADLNVLIVDDSLEIREYMKSVLKSNSIECDVAASGAEAVEKVYMAIKENAPFNIVFVDYKMDGMDGLETSKKLNEIEGNHSVVIMMSAYEMSEIEEEGKRIGVRAFLPKPIFPSSIVNVINVITGAEQISKPVSPFARKYVFEGKRVLVAEDIDVNREILENFLSESRLQISFAEDGAQAVDAFKQNDGKFDLILMDVQMPHIDGYAATKLIRESGLPGADKVPIIALTANAFKEDIAEAFKSGMNGHLSKPLDREKLFSELAKFLSPESESQALSEQEAASESLTAGSIKGIDLDQAMKVVNNNVKLYTHLLESFSKNDIYVKFLESIEKNDVAAAESSAHALKGVSANLSLTDLHKIFSRVDETLKRGIVPKESEIAKLKQAYDEAMETIKAVVANPAVITEAKTQGIDDAK
jgi:CheY-like chemotaxis protein